MPFFIVLLVKWFTTVSVTLAVMNCCIFTVDLQQYPIVFYNNCKILLNIHPSHLTVKSTI